MGFREFPLKSPARAGTNGCSIYLQAGRVNGSFRGKIRCFVQTSALFIASSLDALGRSLGL